MLFAGNYHLLSANTLYCVVWLPGMSEGTGPITLSTITDFRPGSVGKEYEGVEVRINDPDSTGQGEVNCESWSCVVSMVSVAVLYLDLLSWEIANEWVLEQEREDDGSY